MAIGTPRLGAAAANTSAGTTLAVAYPTAGNAPVAGDYMAIVLFINTNDESQSPPAGWTDEISLDCGTNTTPVLRVYSKFAAGGESGTVSCSTASATSQGIMLVVSGVDSTTPNDVAPTSFERPAANTTFPLAAVTLVNSGVTLLAAAIQNSATGTWTEPASPGTWTEALDAATTTPKAFLGYVQGQASGSTGTITVTSSTSVRGEAVLLALRPAAGGTPATMTTVVGTATASGGSASLTGAGTMTGVVGAAPAAGGSATLTGAATMTSVVGAAPASGGVANLTGAAVLGAVVGTAPASGGTATSTGAAVMLGVAGTATAAGGVATMSGGGAAGTMSTVVGTATAAGGSATLTGAAAMSTTVGTAPASGGVASSTGAARMAALAGAATASGGVASLTGAATLTTLAGQATAAGRVALLSGAAILTATRGQATAVGGTAVMSGGSPPSTTPVGARSTGRLIEPGTGHITTPVAHGRLLGEHAARFLTGALEGDIL